MFESLLTLRTASQVEFVFAAESEKRDPLCAKRVTDPHEDDANTTGTLRRLLKTHFLGKCPKGTNLHGLIFFAQSRSYLFEEVPKKTSGLLGTRQEADKRTNP